MFNDADEVNKNDNTNTTKFLSKKKNIKKEVDIEDRFKYYKDPSLKEEANPIIQEGDEEEDNNEELKLNEKEIKKPKMRLKSDIQKTIKSFVTKKIHEIETIANLHYCHVEDIKGNKFKVEFDQVGDPNFIRHLEEYMVEHKISKKQAQIIYKRFDMAQNGNKINLGHSNPEKIVTPKPKKDLKIVNDNKEYLDDEVIFKKLDEVLDKTINSELDNLKRETLRSSKFIKKVTYNVRGYSLEIDYDKYFEQCMPDPKLLNQVKKNGPILCNPVEILKLLKHGISKNNEKHINCAHALFKKYFILYIKDIDQIISKCNGSGIEIDDFSQYLKLPNVCEFFVKDNLLEIKNVRSFVHRGNRWNPDGFIEYANPEKRRTLFFFTFTEISNCVGKQEFDEFLTNKVEKTFKPSINQKIGILNLRKLSIRKKNLKQTFQKTSRIYSQSYFKRNDCFKNSLTKLFGRLPKMGNDFRIHVRLENLESQIEWFNRNHKALKLQITNHCDMRLKDISFFFNRKCLIVFKIDDYRYHTFAFIPGKKITDPTYLMAENSYCEVFVVDYFLK